MKLRILVAASAIAVLRSVSAHADYTYNVDYDVGTDVVTGQIVTNCNNCFLDASSVTSWVFDDSNGFSLSSTPTDGSLSGIDTSGSTGPSPLSAIGNSIVYSPLNSIPGGFGKILFAGTPQANDVFVGFFNGPSNNFIQIFTGRPSSSFQAYPTSEVVIAATAPVPLPASAWMLLSGLVVLCRGKIRQSVSGQQ
jgi:hypothetical protein